MHTPDAYDEIMRNGWPAEKVVAGMLTNPKHGGSGYVPLEISAAVLSLLVERYPKFGGVMGWEYWDALPQEENCWMWAYAMGLCMGMKRVRDAAIIVQMGRNLASVHVNR
jgi:alkaline phosphatase D